MFQNCFLYSRNCFEIKIYIIKYFLFFKSPVQRIVKNASSYYIHCIQRCRSFCKQSYSFSTTLSSPFKIFHQPPVFTFLFTSFIHNPRPLTSISNHLPRTQNSHLRYQKSQQSKLRSPPRRTESTGYPKSYITLILSFVLNYKAVLFCSIRFHFLLQCVFSFPFVLDTLHSHFFSFAPLPFKT